MLTAEFDFELPEEAIAQRPAPRGQSRLLVLDREGEERHRRVRDLPDLLRRGDLLVINDTRVIPARLFARRRPGGGRVELLLVEKTGPREWDVLVKPGRKARPGTVLELETRQGEPATAEALEGLEAGTVLTARMVERPEPEPRDGRRRVRFSEELEPHLDRLGHVPLPPYVKRSDEAEDRATYQTVYARAPGAIAAPTAGLHFTEELLEELRGAGVEVAPVTLHVGIGTFKPVTADLVHEHAMDRERYEIPPETAEAIRRVRAEGRRVVAVGTTVVRTLEGAAARATAAGDEAAGDRLVPPGPGATELFIYPGFRFRVVDVLMTNFHLPKSTLLMLVAAFAGRDRVLAAYRDALREGYHFYSYGDAMLVERGEGRAADGTETREAR